jgi:hypothetical protein
MPWLESENGRIFDMEDIGAMEWVRPDDAPPDAPPKLQVVLRGKAIWEFEGPEAAALNARFKDFRKPEPILPRPGGPRGARSEDAPIPGPKSAVPHKSGKASG